MTASASAWKPAISYSLTGALVLLVVDSSTPPDSAVHQKLPADECVVAWRSPAHAANAECCLFKRGNILSGVFWGVFWLLLLLLLLFFITIEGSRLFPQIALMYQ